MGNCFASCIDTSKRKIKCPKCNKEKRFNKISKSRFLKEGCITCKIKKKYSYRSLDNNTRSKSLKNYYSKYYSL